MSLAFVREIQWWSVNSPHKGPVIRKMFPFDDVMIGYSQDTVVMFAMLYFQHISK